MCILYDVCVLSVFLLVVSSFFFSATASTRTRTNQLPGSIPPCHGRMADDDRGGSIRMQQLKTALHAWGSSQHLVSWGGARIKIQV